MKKPFLIPLLLIAAALMLVSARPASAATLDTPWYGSGPGTLSLGESQFGYTAKAHSGAWTYTAVAASSRVTGIKWQYTGYHAWFQVSVKLERFVQRGGTEIFSETLVDEGPVNCCAAPSGGFSYGGTSKFDVREGDIYGFRMSGSNQDSDSTLRGSLSLTAVDVTPPKISAQVIGNKGPNGYYTGPTTVRWTVTDEESAITERVRCDDTPVTTDMHNRMYFCNATSEGGRATWGVVVNRDATPPEITVPAGTITATARRQTRTVPVTYTASARDAMFPDADPKLSCSRPSGYQFGIGRTTVTCTATDPTGNTASKSFDVLVYAPSA